MAEDLLLKFEKLIEPVRNSKDPDSLAQELFNSLRSLIKVSRIGLYLFNDEQIGLVPVGMESLGVLDLALTMKEEGIINWSMEADKIAFAPSHLQFDKSDANETLVLPLIDNKEKVAILFAVLEESSEIIDKDTRTLLSLLGKQSANAMNNVLKFVETKREMDYLDSLLKTVQEIIYATDDAGLLTYTNARVEILGFKPKDLKNRGVYELIPFDMEQGRTIQVLQEGKSFEYEIELINKNNKTMSFQVYQWPFYDSDGAIHGSLGVMHDISDRKKLEIELQKTQRLKTLSETAISINHEINNPLSVIQGNLFLLEHSFPFDQYPKALQQLEILRQHSNRIAKVVKKLDKIEQLQTIEYAGELKMLDMGTMNDEDIRIVDDNEE